MTQQDVLDFLASCQETDYVNEGNSAFGNIISKTYKFKHGKDLAIATEWGKTFSGNKWWKPSQLSGWQRQLWDECVEASPDYPHYLRKSAAIGKLPSIGF